METTQIKNTHPEIFKKVNKNIKFFVKALNEAHIKHKYELFSKKYKNNLNKIKLEGIWNK